MKHVVLATSMTLAAMLALGCGGKDKGPGATTSNGAGSADVGSADVGTTDSGSATDCVAACVTANEMKAVSAEQIEADCQAECGGSATP